MSDTKPRCGCGKYSGYFGDVGVKYGCKYTPDPEPLDQNYFCKKCASLEKDKFVEAILKNGEGRFDYCNWWQIPLFVKMALNKTGYRMVRSSDNTHFILSKDDKK